MKWAVEFEDDGSLWLRASKTTRELQTQGYAVGAFVNKKTGVRTYTLHKADRGRYPIIHETDSLDQINAYINLILPPRET